MEQIRNLHFHAPCFDGLVSAVLAADFLEGRWPGLRVRLQGVNYDRQERWLTTPLPHDSAVVDFLYHPDARFWADHHQSAFVTGDAEAHFRGRPSPWLCYDGDAPSCASLLWRHLFEAFGHRNPAHEDLVRWADKTDAARYETVEEAIVSRAPALRISTSLSGGADEAYCVGLVDALRATPLSAVADLPEVRRRCERIDGLRRAGLARFREKAHLTTDGIAVFDVETGGVEVPRYAPYWFFPEARYSIGILRGKDSARISAMRNPWKEFPSVPFGRIFAAVGGGGHQRVGSVTLRGSNAAGIDALLARLLADIRAQDASVPKWATDTEEAAHG